MKRQIAYLIEKLTYLLYLLLKPFFAQEVLEEKKLIHLCWWFEKNNLTIPKYFIGGTTPPAVTTNACTAIQTAQVTGNADLTSTGSKAVTVRGFCYMSGTTGDPTTANSVVNESSAGFSTGVYALNITGLSANTSYRVRAYATSSVATAYGLTVQTKTAAIITSAVSAKANFIGLVEPSGSGSYTLSQITGGSGSWEMAAYRYVPLRSGNLSRVGFTLYKYSSPTDDHTIALRTSLTGSDLDSVTINPTSWSSGSSTSFTAYFTGNVSLSAGTSYYFVFYRSGTRDTLNRLATYGDINKRLNLEVWSRSNNVWSISGNASPSIAVYLTNIGNTPFMPNAAKAHFTNVPPTTTLNTPTDNYSTSDTSPTFNFTPTDKDLDKIRSNIQVDRSPEVFWNLNTNADDSLGRYNGSETNISHAVAGKVDNGATFGGTSSIIISNSLPALSSFSVSFWVKSNNNVPENKYFSIDAAGGTDWAIFVGQQSGFYNCGIKSDTWHSYNSGRLVNTSGLDHIVLTWDGTNLTLYQNNSVIIAQTPGGTLVDTASKEIRIGCLNSTTQRTEALIDEVGLWNYCLNTNEVAYIYNGAAGIAFPYFGNAYDKTSGTDDLFSQDGKRDLFIQGTAVNFTGWDSSTTATATYYVDSNKVALFDQDGVWTNESNVVDSDEATYAVVSDPGAVTLNQLQLHGCTADNTRTEPIQKVEFRFYGGAATYGWSSWTELTEPYLGWNWTKVKENLCLAAYGSSDMGGAFIAIAAFDTDWTTWLTSPVASPESTYSEYRLYKVEVRVTYYDTFSEHVFDADTYYWRVRSIDPSGNNVYGNWSTPNRLLITSGTPSTTQTNNSIVNILATIATNTNVSKVDFSRIISDQTNAAKINLSTTPSDNNIAKINFRVAVSNTNASKTNILAASSKNTVAKANIITTYYSGCTYDWNYSYLEGKNRGKQ